MVKNAKRVQSDLLDEQDAPKLAEAITDRLSQELIIALVGPVGSGVSTAAGYVSEILSQKFGYDVAPIIKPSDIIRHEARRVNISVPPRTPLANYISEMQTAGNGLREKFGGNYLAEKVIEQIVKIRTERDGYANVNERKIPRPGRRAYIIDSIKNAEEFDLLRQIYHDTLLLIGVFAPDAVRSKRLEDSGVAKSDVDKLLDRDQDELLTFGQMTRKVFCNADFFICNDQKQDELRRGIQRYLEVIFDVENHTPTRAEAAMYKANAAASNSACMSRQVGAALVGANGEHISVGWNDVPKFGGGLYIEDDQSVLVEDKANQDRDNRCFKYGGKICHNEVRRNDILDLIARRIAGTGLLKKGKTAADVRARLTGTAVDNLTEFSRSIHAEMEAILSVAREGRHSLVNATLYTTTYPCHNCARHIVAAGISTVIYIQPYLKSLATKLHYDAISEDRNSRSMVVFRQYEGVAPRNFLRLFQPTASRKKDGHRLVRDGRTALPVHRIPLDGLVDYELKVVADLASKEHSLNKSAGSLDSLMQRGAS